MTCRLASHSHPLLLLAVAAMFAWNTAAVAQSTSRSYTRPAPKPSTSSQPGSSSRTAASSRLALQGYCPVCVVEMKKWVPGHPSIQVAYDGRTYYFPGEEQKQMFLAAPEKYVPALGGDCVVCLTEMGKRVPGSVRHAALSGNRLFLFPNEDLKKKFTSDPGKYKQADVALGGLCSVCRVEMNQDVAGDPNVSLIHGGMRYQFASDEQRSMFLANPGKYAVKRGTAGSIPGNTSKGSTTR